MSSYIKDMHIYNLFGNNGFTAGRLHVRDIDRMPRANVQEIKHAYWRVNDTIKLMNKDGEWYDTTQTCSCSNCGAQWEFYQTEQRFDYCFHCGAKMDAEEE